MPRGPLQGSSSYPNTGVIAGQFWGHLGALWLLTCLGIGLSSPAATQPVYTSSDFMA